MIWTFLLTTMTAAAGGPCDPGFVATDSVFARGNAHNARILAAPVPDLSGAPVSKFTARVMSLRMQSGGPAQVELLATGALKTLGAFRVVREFSPDRYLAEIDGTVTFVRPALASARDLADAVDQNRLPPDEPARFTFYSSWGVATESPVHLAGDGLEIKRATFLKWARDFMAQLPPTIERRPLTHLFRRPQSPLLMFTHVHPTQDVRFQSRHGTDVVWSSLSPDDLTGAAAVSRLVPRIAYGISAVTLNGNEYVAVFRDGVNVTGTFAEMLSRQ